MKKLSHISVSDMVAEIRRRSRLIARLNRRRTALLAKLAEVEGQIKSRGGEFKSVNLSRQMAGRRPRNAASLVDTMVQAMSKDKPMSVAQIASAVNAKGYRSVSSTFNTIIFQALARDKRFKKVERGLYSLR